MKHIGSGLIRMRTVLTSAAAVAALVGCGTPGATTAGSSPSPAPDVAAARTAAGTIIVPIPNAQGVWGGCAQLAIDYAACPFEPALVARLNQLSSGGYFADGPPGVCGEDYITGTQNGLFAAPQILSASANPNGTVTVVIQRGTPPPNFTVTMTNGSGKWLASDLASGTGSSASIFSAKPNC
jgi:hypothetical protein